MIKRFLGLAMDDTTAQDTWKDQYQDLHNRFEEKEKEWETLESVLRRTGSQLAVAAMGRDEELDSTVGELRVFLKDGTASQDIDGSLERLRSAIRATMFAGRRGSPEVQKAIQRLVVKLVQNMAEIPALSGPIRDLKWRLEAGVNLRQIQVYLGHNSVQTTSCYTHLTSISNTQACETIDQLMQGL